MSAALNGWLTPFSWKTLRFVMDPRIPLVGSGVDGLSLWLLCKTGQQRRKKGVERHPFSVVPHSGKGFARARGGFLDDIKTGFGRYWIRKPAGRHGRPAFNRSNDRFLGVSESSSIKKASKNISFLYFLKNPLFSD